MSNRRDIQFTYNPHNKATILDCSFVVDSRNGNGQGTRSLKDSGRIKSVFMNTSAAFTGTSHSSVLVDSISGGTASLVVGMLVQGSGVPAGAVIASIVDSSSVTLNVPTTTSTTGSITYQLAGNPNPAAGVIVVNLQDNYNRYLGGYAGFVSPVSGSPISSGLTVGAPAIIVHLGASSLAQWQAAGLPLTLVPAVGVSFIAAATSVAGGGLVEVPLAGGSGIDHIEVLGDANLMNSNGVNVVGAGLGMQLILLCFKNGVLAAPANGCVIGLNFYMNNSAQGV
jgi:hypothetical protein